MTSSPNDLTSRLRSRLEADRRQIEETAARELERLGESLSAVASGALRSIEADTAAATERVSVLLRRAWLRPLVISLSLFLGISGGNWATMQWLSKSIERRIETLAAANVQIEEARWTLAEIEEATWGVTLREIDGERFVVLPAGTLDRPAGRAAKRASDILGPGLQDARRDVARALDLMRQRGGMRDHGPSR